MDPSAAAALSAQPTMPVSRKRASLLEIPPTAVVRRVPVMRSAWVIPVYRTRHWLAVLVSFALPDRYARTETVSPPVARLVQTAILRVMAVDPAVMVVLPAVALGTAVLMEETTVEALEDPATEDPATEDPAVVPTEVQMEVPMGEATVPLLAMAQAMEAPATVAVAVDPMGDHQAATVVLQVMVQGTDQTAATRKETVADLVQILVVTALLLATVVEMAVQL